MYSHQPSTMPGEIRPHWSWARIDAAMIVTPTPRFAFPKSKPTCAARSLPLLESVPPCIASARAIGVIARHPLTGGVTVSQLLLRKGHRVALPDVLEGFRKGLLFHCAIGVPGVAREDELVVIAFGGQHPGHVLVGQHPVVIVVARAQIIPVAYFHPDAYRLHRAVRNQVFVELPGAVGRLGIRGPLLVHVSAGVGENAVVQLR